MNINSILKFIRDPKFTPKQIGLIFLSAGLFGAARGAYESRKFTQVK